MATAAAGFGHTDISAENGVVRGLYLASGIDRPDFPAFALVLQRVENRFANLQLIGERSPISVTETKGSWLRDYRVLIPFGGPSGSFTHLSYVDVLSSDFDLAALRNETVLIGVTAVGLGDTFVAPTDPQGGLMSGVVLQTTCCRR